VTAGVRAADLVEQPSAYNAARLREACALFVTRMLEPDVTVGLSLTGALTPAGLGLSCLTRSCGRGSWTGSSRRARTSTTTSTSSRDADPRGRPDFDDVALRDEGIIRIYDIVFPYEVLLDTDAFFREI